MEAPQSGRLICSPWINDRSQYPPYGCEIEVLPILIPFEDYEKEPDREVLERMNDGLTNIIFTGRVVPNKKQGKIPHDRSCTKTDPRFCNMPEWQKMLYVR